MADLAERVRKIIIEVLDVEPARVTDDARCVRDLNADSLDLLEILISVEDEFEVEMPETAFMDATTVGEAIAVVRKTVEG